MKDIKFIAEVGSNGNNDISRIKKLIDSAKELGFWAVKFQKFKADRLYFDKKHYDILKEREFPDRFIPLISEYCKAKDIKLGFSVFYKEAVDELKHYVDYFKISSFDILRHDLIKKCIMTGKPLHFSAGLATDYDLYNINEIKPKFESVLYHCVSGYPTKPKNCCLDRIRDFCVENELPYRVGYSDHSVCISVIIQSILNGAKYIEMHFDLDDMKGAESDVGHVWPESKCKELFNFINDMKIARDGYFKLSEYDLSRRAHADDGLRHIE